MLTISIDDFMLELKNGSIKNIGPPTKSGTAKLFNVDTATAREFGDNRIKLEFVDEDGNEVQIALFPEKASSLATELTALQEQSTVFD